MDIVCISDTHNRHAELRLPPGDVLIHAGDYSMQGHVAETEAFLSWFAAQPHRHKVFIAGNHDLIIPRLVANSRMASPEGGWSLPGLRKWWDQTPRSEFANRVDLEVTPCSPGPRGF